MRMAPVAGRVSQIQGAPSHARALQTCLPSQTCLSFATQAAATSEPETISVPLTAHFRDMYLQSTTAPPRSQCDLCSANRLRRPKRQIQQALMVTARYGDQRACKRWKASSAGGRSP